MAKGQKVPVTMRALIQRINRKLAHEEEVLKAVRSGPYSDTLGAYIVLDLNRNAIIDRDAEPEELGRKLGVLKPWEQLVEEDAK